MPLSRMMVNHITKLADAQLHNRKLVILSVLFAYLAVLIGGALAVSARRLLWHDELYTFYIATLPSFSQVWSALSTGQEQTPPAYYAIVRGSLGIFGNNNIALRLPSLIGFLIMAVALFNFVSLRLSPICGAIAAMFPMVTGVQYYVHEARPYGLELGFAALALLCWQRATEDRNRLVALGGLWFSLAAAISCHYYGVLLILPLAIGEVVRTVGRRGIDFAIWACFAASLLPLLFVLQLILRATKAVGGFWAQPHWGDVGRFYLDILPISLPLFVVSLTFAMIAPRFLAFGRSEPPAPEPTFPDHEIGVLLGFLALPLFGMLLAEFVTKAFTDRYVLPAVLGISVLFAQTMYKLVEGRFRIAVGIALLLLTYFMALELREITIANNDRSGFEKSITVLRSANREGLPIVIGDPQTFVMFAHYAPSDVQSRLVYLASPALAGRILGFTSIENGMVQLVGPWFHMKVVPFEDFLKSNARFLLYGGWEFNWVNRALSDRLFRVEFLARPEGQTSNDRYLFYVTPRDSKE
jgi:hypothetical protein